MNLDQLGEEVRQVQDAALEDERMRAEVRQRLLSVSPRKRRSELPRRAVTMLAVAAAVSLVAWGAMGFREQDLHYSIEGHAQSASEGQIGQVLEAEAESLSLAFSDGSTVRLEPESLASVPAVSAHGALVHVHSGRAHFDVEHQDETRWAVQAGPYTVHVVGTTFDVAWDEQARTLAVQVSEGRVRLEGPEVESVEVRAGDRVVLATPEATAALPAETDELQAGVDDATLEATASASETGMAAEPGTRVDPVPSEGTSAPANAEHMAQERRTAPARRWRARGAAGDYAGALAALDEAGFGPATQRMGAAELMTVAGWARRAGDARAATLYRRVRTRFSGSEEAAEAAFLLGRMSVSRSEALRWWRTYESEQPAGRYAVQNAGRLLETLSALGRREEAARRATRYLANYPDGPHRRLAEALAEP